VSDICQVARFDEMMQNLMEVIYEFVVAQMVQTTPSARQNKLWRRLHRDIVAAIEDYDADAAERVVREHMEVILSYLKKGQPK